jgi:hypothetical protein
MSFDHEGREERGDEGSKVTKALAPASGGQPNGSFVTFDPS